MTVSSQQPEGGLIGQAAAAKPDAPAAAPRLALLGCRGVSWSMILLGLVCLFLPWVKGCGKDPSGWEVVWMCLSSPVHIPISLYPLFLLTGLIASLWFVRRRRPVVVMTAACLAAAGSLLYGVLSILVGNALDTSPSEWLQGVQDTFSGFLPAYWAALTAPLVAALFGWIEYRLRGDDRPPPLYQSSR